MTTAVRSNATIRLNDKQVLVLRWIAAGCPDSIPEDHGYRISAAALRSRGLARVSGRGPSWTANLTHAGQRYLDKLDGRSRSAVRVPVDDGLHPIARDFRDRIERHEVSRQQLGRAVRLVQMLIEGSEQRGWAVSTATESENEVGLIDWASAKDGHIVVSVGVSQYWIRLQEEGVRPRAALEDEDAADAFDASASGRLKLELRWGEWFTRKQSRWADRPGMPLEDRVVDLLREIEERAADAERIDSERRARAAHAEAEATAVAEARQSEWALLMDDARARFGEAHRGEALLQQVEDFERALRIRAYCDAVSGSAREAALDPEVAAWVEWARGYADRLDPVTGAGPRAPESVEPPPAALEEYLPDGWSAEGP